jgi:eukaryotic-like serine/threonine-protein kinase
VGEVFAGRYELVDLLGEGGMGAVWRAFDHRSGCYVAAKVLRQSDAVSLLRFVREQSFRISHPHVVAPRGWAGEDDRVLFTMDLVRGGSLATLLGDYGPLPAQWVAVLIDQVLSGLSAVHAAGLVHRDIKPGNVLLEPTGRSVPLAKLTDFGVAVAVSEPRLTSTSQLLGTPGYLAPEAVRGADPQPRQDLYAVGVLTAELLCGARPELDGGLPAVAPPPGGLPERLWSWARRLAAWKPDDRPETADRARVELAELGVLPPPGAVPDDGGADIEVLDVVPELPPGWGPSGRGGSLERSMAGPRDVVPQEASPSEVSVEEVSAEEVSAEEVSAEEISVEEISAEEASVEEVSGEEASAQEVALRNTAQTGARAATRSATTSAPVPGPAPAPRAAPSDPATRPGRGGRRRWPLALTSFLLIAAGLALGTWVLTNDALWSRPAGNSSPNPATSHPGRTGQPPPAPASGCDFTEAGRRETASSGEVLVCRQQPDGSYRWVP